MSITHRKKKQTDHIRKLLLSMRRRYITLTHGSICILNRDKILWAVNPHDRMLRYYYRYCTGWYNVEEQQMAFLLKLCAQMQPSVFIDVGANYGYYTMMLSKRVPSIARVEAFEPTNSIARYLRMNVLINDLQDHVHIHTTALSNQSGESVILIDPKDPTIGTLPETGQEVRFPHRARIRQPVVMDTLDNVVNLQGEKMLIKIDVEGNEFAVLEGAENILKNNACLVQMEVFKTSRKPVEEFMSSINYKFIDEISSTNYSDMWFVSPSLNIDNGQ